MTVSSEKSSELYSGNGSARIFPYTFKVIEASHLVVTLADDEGNETVLVLDTDYSVSGVGSDTGGNVTYPKNAENSALPSGHRLAITREVPFKQTTNFENQGGFFPETHETSFDLTTMLAQQLKETQKRCLKLAKTSGLDGEEYLATFQQAMSDAISSAQTAQTGAESAQSSAEAAQASAEAAQASAEAAQTDASAILAQVESYANEFIKLTYEATATAGQTQIDLTATALTLPISLDNLSLYISGVKQAKSSLTRVSDKVLTFGGALEGGEAIELVFGEFSPTALNEAIDAATQAAASAAAAAQSAEDAAQSAEDAGNSGDLASHENDTSTHGVTTSIAGTGDVQTLSNKNFSDLTPFGAGFCIGDPGTDGSYRFTIVAGVLTIDKRVSGSWVTQSTIGE